MLLTKECDYAIRVIKNLAEKDIETVGMICENEMIPRPFAYKILKKLDHAGIVTAYRGAAGGYKLAKDPVEITLFDIINTIDNHLLVSDCLIENHTCPCHANGRTCTIRAEMERLQGVLVSALSEKRVSELI